jgi:hypothetical protein
MEKPEASSSSSSLRRDQVEEEEHGAGEGGASGAVVVPVPEVGAGVASGPGTSGSEASAEEILWTGQSGAAGVSKTSAPVVSGDGKLVKKGRSDRCLWCRHLGYREHPCLKEW